MLQDYIYKALESLKAVRILFGAECYNSRVSRCYYAMFQMAIAALERFGIKPRREGEYKHFWVQAAVAGELIRKRKILPGKLASSLPDALKLREQADYGTLNIGKKRAERALRKTTEFIKCLEEVLT